MFQHEKMADKDMLCWQLSVIRLLVKEEIPTSNIHAWLHPVYGDVCMGRSSVRWWVKHSEGRNTDISHQPLCGFLQTACTRNSRRETDLVRENWLVTVRDMAAETGIAYHVVQEMVQNLGYLKDCACYISGGTQTSVKKYFLMVGGTVCCRRRQLCLQHPLWSGKKMTEHGMASQTSCKKKKPEQCPQPIRPWELTFEMLKDA